TTPLPLTAKEKKEFKNSKFYKTHLSYPTKKLDPAAPEGAYHLVKEKAGVKSVFTNNPLPKKMSEAGTSAKDLSLTVTKWGRWVEVNFDPADPKKVGLIRIDDPKVKILSAFDWLEEWRAGENWHEYKEDEKEKYSTDGFCDVPALLGLIADKLNELVKAGAKEGSPEKEHGIDKDQDKKITAEEIKQAVRDARLDKIDDVVRDAKVAAILRRSACLHPTEWDGIADGDMNKWDKLEKAPYKMEGEPLAQTKEHIKKMQWWPKELTDDKKKKVDGWPEGNKVWHFHPIGFIENLRHFFRGITSEQLKLIAPGVPGKAYKKYAALFNKLFWAYEINTRLRQAHFIAQILHECNEIKNTEEIRNGKVYDYRWGLSNYLPGDGERFKGRGLIQITGRSAYARYGAFINEDTLTDPKGKLLDEFYTFDSAAWFSMLSKKNTPNESADMDDLWETTIRVNGLYNGLDHRFKYLLKARRALMDEIIYP
ncbi:MAG: glycoside hydrolase family 19 protein, partial [Pyrinomonadaceae bacterium]